ncbi:MAG TPA: YkgJ family cysteine cluster protein, partial [Isosphaeraceae bacterium]|nr:YkgJ family cysteine cluster protein [Isosphaeraceae bacterium]
MSSAESPWYRDGLQFECTRCGACCTGAPGFVWVDEAEIARLAAYRGEQPEEFTRKYVRQVG